MPLKADELRRAPPEVNSHSVTRSTKAEVGRAEVGRRDAVEGQRVERVEGDEGCAARGGHVGLHGCKTADEAAAQADRILGRVEPGDLGLAKHPATEIEDFGNGLSRQDY